MEVIEIKFRLFLDEQTDEIKQIQEINQYPADRRMVSQLVENLVLREVEVANKFQQIIPKKARKRSFRVLKNFQRF